jgi:hypothetical protein
MRRLETKVADRRPVVVLDVRQAPEGQSALAGETVALELDGDLVLLHTAQIENEGLDGGLGLAVHGDLGFAEQSMLR